VTEAGLPYESPPWPALPQPVRVTVAILAGLVLATVVAYLTATGRPEFALGLLLAMPAAHIAVKYPLSAMVLWLVAASFVVEISGGMRMLFWIVHRAVPPLAVLNVLLAEGFAAIPRLPRLSWAEAMMFCYVVITELSILFTSSTVVLSSYRLYDRVVVPMCLYMLVRLVQPEDRHLRRLLPIVAFVLLAQAGIGALQWVAPGTLPAAWAARAGTRTTGSLLQPGVYSVTILAAGLILLHLGMQERHRLRGRLSVWLFPLALVMVFMTYSRASWLAGLIVLLGLFTVYPQCVTKLSLGLIAIVVALVLSGVVQAEVERAQVRFLSEGSERSALSRLPVMAASVRMLQSRPVTGWGFDSFDEYDRQFQGSVGGLVVPEKDHSSHNLYLTILAEQGLPGFMLYMGPFFYWLARTRKVRAMPVEGIVSRKLLLVLWLMLLTHVVVNNYANMRVEWGLGLWWVTLGLIASLVVRYDPFETARSALEKDLDEADNSVGAAGWRPRA
jgi:O-antigen ligase